MTRLVTDFEQPAQKPRTKKAMAAYLDGHPRYHTMNSWNRSTSYARNIKLHHIEFPDKATRDRAWELACSDAPWWEDAGLSDTIALFAERWNHRWQLGTNGRSGGYVVLYQGGTEPSGYQSHCTACGQRNYARVERTDESPEGRVRKFFFEHPMWVESIYLTQGDVKAVDVSDTLKLEYLRQARRDYDRWNKNVTTSDVCGRCGARARVNYVKSPVRVVTWPGRGVDEDRDYAEWDKDALAARVEVVWDLDNTVEEMAKKFIAYARGHAVVEETVMVPTRVRRAKKIEG